ncbi:MAG: SMC-Scp complex subunit ScpB [Sulfurifustaceae bacterium]
MSEANAELKNIIEAALLVAGQPLTLERMAQMFPDDSRPTREEIREVLKQLEAEYAERGFELKQVDRAYRLQTRVKYNNWLGRLVEERPARYSRALLETLAIIAYRQPVTRGDIEDIRGVAVSGEIIKTLLDRDWIREVGRREVPGRPVLYGTTRAFLEYFNLSKLEDLPPLAELRDIAAISAELDQRAAASGETQPPAASEMAAAESQPAPESSGDVAASDAGEAEPVPAYADGYKPSA